MKKLFLFGVIASVLASCSSVEIAKRQHRSGYYVSFGNKSEVKSIEAKSTEKLLAQELTITESANDEVTVIGNNEEVVTENNVAKQQNNVVTPSKSNNNNVFTQTLNEEKVETKKTTFAKKIAKKGILGKLKKADDNVMLLILVILAIIIPPIAVGLKTNWALKPLLINLLLLFLGFLIPIFFFKTSLAIIHALLVVFDVI
jgi:uncharacterized membrane protein YqaE (UPF0057 family)